MSDDANVKPRAGAVIPLAGVSVATILWVLARSTFYEGYFDALGVPEGLPLTPALSVTSIVVVVLSTFGSITGIWNLSRAQLFGKGPFASLASRSFGVLMFGVFTAGVIATLGGSRAWFGLVAIVAVLISILFWIEPFFSGKEGKTYRDKIIAARKPRPLAPEPPMPPQDFWGLLSHFAGPAAIFVVGALMFTPFVGLYLGRRAAQYKTTWVQVSHPSLAPIQDGSWVLIAMAEGKLWVAEAHHGTLARSVVPVSIENASLTSAELGSLKPAPLPAPSPQLRPNDGAGTTPGHVPQASRPSPDSSGASGQ